MSSTFTWLDYSERDRRRALDVVDLFREATTLDELGIGSIRDGLADVMFPGTSTIQTRARYFLLLPWLYLWLEGRAVPASQFADRARREELRLNEAVLRSGDKDEAFGKLAGGNLKRLASSVYWAGLGSWGIRLFPGPQSAYHRGMDRFYQRRQAWRARTREEEEHEGPPANWHPRIPTPPADFPSRAALRLRREDAVYLQERIIARHPGSLLGWLAHGGDGDLLKSATPWPLLDDPSLRGSLREALLQARRFSDLMHGAALLYNLMLAELLGEVRGTDGRAAEERSAPTGEVASAARRQALPERYRAQIAEWAARLAPVEDDLRSWDLAELWEPLRQREVRVGLRTQHFVADWLGIVRDLPRWIDLPEEQRARRLISERELLLKKNRARLHSRRHLELWGGASGTQPLDYRWPKVQRMLGEILAAT